MGNCPRDYSRRRKCMVINLKKLIVYLIYGDGAERKYDKGAMYRIQNVDFCCARMRGSSGWLEMVYKDDEGEECEPSVAMKMVQVSNSYEDTFEDEYHSRISFCPYCGAKIVVNVAETEDVRSKCVEIKNEMDKVIAKFHSSDSVSERASLSKEHDRLSKLENQLFLSDCDFQHANSAKMSADLEREE